MTEHEYWCQQQIIKSGKYPFTKGQLAHFMLFRHKNGLEKAVRKIGKRCYLRMDLFEEWIESQASKGGQR